MLSAKSFSEALKNLRLFPVKTRTNVAFQVMALVYNVGMIIKAFISKICHHPYFKLLFGHHEEFLGAMISSMWLTIGIAMTEILNFRIWIAHEHLYVRSKKPSFFFFFFQIPRNLHELLLKIAKSNYITLILTLAALFILMEALQLVHTEDTIEMVTQFFWLFATLYYIRYMAVDLSLIFVIAFAIYKTIEINCDTLIRTAIYYGRKLNTSYYGLVEITENSHTISLTRLIQRAELELNFVDQITTRYLKIVHSIICFKSLARLLLVTSDLLAVPAFSNTIYHLSLQPKNNLEVLLKPVGISAGILFFSRSYIITAVFSGIHTQSRYLHNHLASVLARKYLSPRSKRSILTIMESLASSRNCMAIPQGGGQFVRQIDTLFNFLNTLQFVLLISDFEMTNRFK